MSRTTVAGVGGIAFSVLTVAGFAVSLAPGGNYKESQIADYLAKGHRPAVFVAFYLGPAGVFGLVCLVAELREALRPGHERSSSVVWGTALAGAASFGVGWAVIGGQVVAHTEGGHSIVVLAPLTYLIGELGVVMIFGSGAVLVGIALIALGLAARGVLPSWLRWL